jgi:CubicO group peptidase (beta-lactamase class C family)
MIKKIVSGLLLVCLAGCGNSQYKKKEPATIDSIIEENAKQFLQDKRLHSVSIVVLMDNMPIIKHFGEQTIGKGKPPTDSTFYELASVTKTFTGTIAAKAVIDKKISLDDDIRNYLGEGYGNLEYDGDPITIKHLLTHTSGFPNFPIKGENKEAFLEGLKLIKINEKPGKYYSYSNTAPELTAYILEKVYEQPYQNLVYKFILEPNKMYQTKFILDVEDKKRLINGYNGNNELQPHYINNLWGGISGLHATTLDLVKYMKFQLDSSNLMVNLSHRKLYKEGSDFWMGYHWYILEKEGDIIYRHHGGIYGMQNWFMIYPEQNIGISILTNASFEDTGDLMEETTDKIIEGILKVRGE